MRKTTGTGRRLHNLIAARLEAHRVSDDEREKFARVINCPSCGDTNRDVIVESLDANGSVTRSICGAPVDDGIAYCGCRHVYHAA